MNWRISTICRSAALYFALTMDLAAAKPPVILTDATDSYKLSAHKGRNHLEYLEDKELKFTFEQISAPDTEYLEGTGQIQDFKKTDSAFWLRFRLEDQSETGRRWLVNTNRMRTFVLHQILSFGIFPPRNQPPPFGEIDLYIPVDGHVQMAGKSGEFVRGGGDGLYLSRAAPFDAGFDARDLQSRYLTFLLPPGVDWNRPFYAYFSHEFLLSGSFRVQSLTGFLAKEHHSQIRYGLFFGLVAALLCYNLFLFVSLRDVSYLYYVAYILAISLFVVTYLGLGFEYLWSDSPRWNRDSLYVFAGLTVTFAALFTRSFLDVASIAPRLDRILLVVVGGGLLSGLVGYFSVDWGDRFSYLASGGLLVSCFLAGVRSLQAGYRPGRYYMTAWSILLVCTLYYLLHNIGLTRLADSGIDILQLGIGCEVILLSLGLADRIKLLDQEVHEQEAAAREAKLKAQTFEEELDTASRLQQELMPGKPPEVSGFDIAGRCIPMNHVGGDFYQYHRIAGGRLAISVADVTGHAMEAAIPSVMFSGILESQMESGASLEELFARLNRTLYKTLDRRTFVCLLMGELDPTTRRFRVSNCGCPYPYHYRSATGDLSELVQDSYPLSIRPDSVYAAIDTRLEPDDRVVFCSDGIVEAMNDREAMFGFDRTGEVILEGCVEDLSATQLIDRLMGRVQEFIGDIPRADDMTCVVVRSE